MIKSHIPIGQPILVQDYILQVLWKPFKDFLRHGIELKWMDHAQVTLIYGEAKLNLPSDIDL